MKSLLRELLSRLLKADWKDRRAIILFEDHIHGISRIVLESRTQNTTQNIVLQRNFLRINDKVIPLHRIRKIVVNDKVLYNKK